MGLGIRRQERQRCLAGELSTASRRTSESPSPARTLSSIARCELELRQQLAYVVFGCRRLDQSLECEDRSTALEYQRSAAETGYSTEVTRRNSYRYRYQKRVV